MAGGHGGTRTGSGRKPKNAIHAVDRHSTKPVTDYFTTKQPINTQSQPERKEEVSTNKKSSFSSHSVKDTNSNLFPLFLSTKHRVQHANSSLEIKHQQLNVKPNAKDKEEHNHEDINDCNNQNEIEKKSLAAETLLIEYREKMNDSLHHKPVTKPVNDDGHDESDVTNDYENNNSINYDEDIDDDLNSTKKDSN